MSSSSSASPEPTELRIVPAGPGSGLYALRRWWALILLGAGLVVGATYGLLTANPGDYTAQGVLEMDQPSITAGATQGLQATQKLINLVPTLAARATSDDVLNRVRDDTGFTGSVQDLRNQVVAAPVPSQLAISITASNASAGMAVGLARATIAAFRTQLQADQSAESIPPSLQLVILELIHPRAMRPNQQMPRTLGLAGAVALVVLAGFVLLVEYLRASG